MDGSAEAREVEGGAGFGGGGERVVVGADASAEHVDEGEEGAEGVFVLGEGGD